MNIKNFAVLALALAATLSVQAQSKSKWRYDNNSTDQLIFSWTPLSSAVPGLKVVPRFSYFWNVNASMRRDFGNKASLLFGASIKNIGDRRSYDPGGGVAKQVSISRYYTIGIPAAVRFGNIKKKQWGGIDFGFDVPFAAKSKVWNVGDKRNKQKASDWFPNNTNYFVPYVGASGSFGKFGVKYIHYLVPFADIANAPTTRYVSLFLNLGGSSSGTGAVRKKINLKSKSNTL
jgi:hypothetical protein